jgi:hypothetical protein
MTYIYITYHISYIIYTRILLQYALAMLSDCVVIVSSLEYVYEGKARWPRTTATAAFFGLQVS